MEHARREFEKIAVDYDTYFERRKRQIVKNKGQNSAESSGESQTKKQALKVAATKWFPYGYGPAKGTSFVVEDMTEVSDDEEQHDEFQYQRIEQEGEIPQHKKAVGGGWFDEYQTARKMEEQLPPIERR